MTVLLLLLLSRRRRNSWLAPVTLGLLIANLALSAEQVFLVVMVGMFLGVVLNALIRRARRLPFQKAVLAEWGVPLVIAGILALVQGGYLSDAVYSVISRFAGQSYPMVTTDFQGFSFRWPPAVPTGHFGPLSLFDPGQIAILLAEAGPALFLLPVVVAFTLRKLPGRVTLVLGLALGSFVTFVLPIFFRYGLDFDITRLVAAALWLWYALSFPVIWRWLKNARQPFRYLAGAGYAVAIYAGVVMFAVQLIAIPKPQTTYYLDFTETYFSRTYWNRLEPNAMILDNFPERAVLLFGRASTAGLDVYNRSPEWKALIADPDPVKVARAGYTYIYMNEKWFADLNKKQRDAFQQPCVSQIDRLNIEDRAYRQLWSVKACLKP